MYQQISQTYFTWCLHLVRPQISHRPQFHSPRSEVRGLKCDLYLMWMWMMRWAPMCRNLRCWCPVAGVRWGPHVFGWFLWRWGLVGSSGRRADVTSESVQGSHTLGRCLKWLCRIFSKYRDVLSFNGLLLPLVPWSVVCVRSLSVSCGPLFSHFGV